VQPRLPARVPPSTGASNPLRVERARGPGRLVCPNAEAAMIAGVEKVPGLQPAMRHPRLGCKLTSSLRVLRVFLASKSQKTIHHKEANRVCDQCHGADMHTINNAYSLERKNR
jgi:hypothetical protein